MRGGHWFVRVLASFALHRPLSSTVPSRDRASHCSAACVSRARKSACAPIGSKKGHDMACGWAFFEKARTDQGHACFVALQTASTDCERSRAAFTLTLLKQSLSPLRRSINAHAAGVEPAPQRCHTMEENTVHARLARSPSVIVTPSPKPQQHRSATGSQAEFTCSGIAGVTSGPPMP